jgi:ATP-binding cassette subfamily B protein
MKSKVTSEFLENLCGELLDDKHSLRFRMRGNSMFPTIKDGEIGIVQKCELGDLIPGDIVVFKSDSGLIAHRLVRKSTFNGVTHLITRGDKNTFNDPPFTADKIIGKIIFFKSGVKQKSATSSWFRIKGKIILYSHLVLVPVFNFALRVKNLHKRIINQQKLFRDNIKLISMGSEKIFAINIIIAILQGILPFAVIFCLKWLIDSISQIESSNFSSAKPFVFVLVLSVLVFLLNAIVTVIRNYFFEKLSFSVSLHIHGLLHSKHSALDMAYYEDSEQQDKIHRAVQEAGYRPVKILGDLLQVIRAILSGLVIVALFVGIKWYLIFILIPSVLPGIFVRLKHSKNLHRIKKENSTRERQIYYYNRVLTALPFAKELKLFAFTPFFQKRFNETQNQLFKQNNSLSYRVMWFDIAAQTFSVLTVFGVFGFIAYMAIDGKTSIGTVAMSFLILQRGYSVLADFSRSATQIVEDNIFLSDLVDFLNFPVTSINKSETVIPSPLSKGIVIENVSFRYKMDHKLVLDNVSISIPANKTVALIGKNGSGKTTMVKLLCGFYQPISGKILFDDIDTGKLNPEEIRKNITAVFQDFALYNLTAAENIALGNIHSNFDLEKVKEAAQKAGVDDIIEKLPNGYANLLGNLFAGGKELSIGQWQKFAIARAFYRNSPILIFDEPSSALDAEAEQQVLHRLKELSKNKTVIIVTHRKSTIDWADVVYEFDEGRVAQVKISSSAEAPPLPNIS